MMKNLSVAAWSVDFNTSIFVPNNFAIVLTFSKVYKWKTNQVQRKLNMSNESIENFSTPKRRPSGSCKKDIFTADNVNYLAHVITYHSHAFLHFSSKYFFQTLTNRDTKKLFSGKRKSPITHGRKTRAIDTNSLLLIRSIDFPYKFGGDTHTRQRIEGLFRDPPACRKDKLGVCGEDSFIS